MAAEGYDDKFMQYTAESSAYAAHFVTTRLSSVLRVRSVMDVGCARGTWLRAWIKQGVTDVRGVDGAYVDSSQLEVPPDLFVAHDLSEQFKLGRRFDLVQCLEVAEHLPPDTSSSLVATLADHAARYVMFSAAPPGQGGEYHVNERSYEFWRGLFRQHGFLPFDFLRPMLANEAAVSFWYRYNIVLYVREDAIPGLEAAVSATRIPEAEEIPDVSPPLFRVRKAIVRWLPAPVQDRIARAKARFAATKFQRG
ncbi:methyltransferase domain-containing protein [Bradyrhizobium sp. dw_411]|uniref:methyltransferase domain-containing protein n=1 Tax=Bradyrhizobium sp. dw_411 TaxID=2720082 RepID=UPI001BCA755D|nr:methyltransferase domain-containing protein [Bradyrhizobium sp. dw_411]